MNIIVTGGAGFIGSKLCVPHAEKVSGLPDHLSGQADLCRQSVHTGPVMDNPNFAS